MDDGKIIILFFQLAGRSKFDTKLKWLQNLRFLLFFNSCEKNCAKIWKITKNGAKISNNWIKSGFCYEPKIVNVSHCASLKRLWSHCARHSILFNPLSAPLDGSTLEFICILLRSKSSYLCCSIVILFERTFSL